MYSLQISNIVHNEFTLPMTADRASIVRNFVIIRIIICLVLAILAHLYCLLSGITDNWQRFSHVLVDKLNIYGKYSEEKNDGPSRNPTNWRTWGVKGKQHVRSMQCKLVLFHHNDYLRPYHSIYISCSSIIISMCLSDITAQLPVWPTAWPTAWPSTWPLAFVSPLWQ